MRDAEIQRVLDFWFSDDEADSPDVESRMDRWFGSNDDFDARIEREFGELVERASEGNLAHWTQTPDGSLALIILLDQFRRNIYRGSAEAFAKDDIALQLCLDGIEAGFQNELTPKQCIFLFMPMQHCESLEIQQKAVENYRSLAERVDETMRETCMTALKFAEWHHDIVAEYGRFPHRNRIVGRSDTEAEAEYLTGGGPTFGQ